MTTPLELAAKEVLLLKKALLSRALMEGIWGVVVSAQTGPPKTLTMKIGGSSLTTAGIRYSDTITTPTANDMLLLAKIGTDLVAVLRLAT